MTNQTKGLITKDKIIEESRQLFAEKGYEGTSMSDVAEAVGIKKASLYYFFKNKEILFVAVLDQIWSKLCEDMVEMCKKREEYGSDRAHFAAILKRLIDNSMQGGVILGISKNLCEKKPSALKSIFGHITFARRSLTEGLKKYKVDDPEAAAEVLINACHAYIVHRNDCKSHIGIKKYADYLASILIKEK
jgi:AcrR family transcriptional regulator